MKRCTAKVTEIGLALLGVVVGSGCTTVLKTDFETDPVTAGWECGGPYGSDASDFLGQWGRIEPATEGHCLSVRKGLWQSPRIPVVPHAYYRLAFAAQSDRMGFYAFRFFEADGSELTSDDYNAFDASPAWRSNEVLSQVRENAASMRVAFMAGEREVLIDDVEISRATAADVVAWNDRLYRTLPKVRYEPSPDRWRHLGATRALLEGGKELRVVLLGDSIANDLGNAQPHLLIQRLYPGSTVVLLRSIRSATGSDYYQHHVNEYVADKNPDLVIIAGISHHGDADAVRNVVEQTRRLTGRPVEFLVMTGAIKELVGEPGHKAGKADPPKTGARPDAVKLERGFHATLAGMRDELGIATLDLRTIWEDYLVTCGQPRSWFQRDIIHANSRGKQIMARVLERFFMAE
jgi:hypothetical protein